MSEPGGPDPAAGSSFADGSVATRLPARDLGRARRFYNDALGLEPAEERPGGLLYRVGSGTFALFESQGERGFWFRDSEGNVLGVGQPVR